MVAVREPVAMPEATATVAVADVPPDATVTAPEVTPVPLNVSVVCPATKPVPASVTPTELGSVPSSGVIEVKVGGFPMVNELVAVAFPRGVVTVTSRAPVGALAAMVKVVVADVPA